MLLIPPFHLSRVPPVFMWEAKTARRQILERKVGQKDAIVLFGKRQSIVAAAVEEVVAVVVVLVVVVVAEVVVVEVAAAVIEVAASGQLLLLPFSLARDNQLFSPENC